MVLVDNWSFLWIYVLGNHDHHLTSFEFMYFNLTFWSYELDIIFHLIYKKSFLQQLVLLLSSTMKRCRIQAKGWHAKCKPSWRKQWSRLVEMDLILAKLFHTTIITYLHFNMNTFTIVALILNIPNSLFHYDTIFMVISCNHNLYFRIQCKNF